MTKTVEVDFINKVPEDAWKIELELTSFRYHKVAAIVAIIFDPIFAINDYYTIPDHWQTIFFLRLSVSLITLLTLLLRPRLSLPPNSIVLVPFLLISLQNAFTYLYLTDEDLLGQNLNYIALLIGGAMFVSWKWHYSIIVLVLSVIATAAFIHFNPFIVAEQFFVKGGLLLIATGVFMFALIKTRYDLSLKEIKARLALQMSNEEISKRNIEIKTQNEEIQAQAEEISVINENLEKLVHERTRELETKNKTLEEYAFINAHKLRSPVARILGLTNLASKIHLSEDDQTIMAHLQRSTEELDAIVSSITKTIERGQNKRYRSSGH